jgi:hypothetical protein
MVFATFNMDLVIYRTCAIGREGSGCSCLLPLSIMFQSFTTRVLWSGHSED